MCIRDSDGWVFAEIDEWEDYCEIGMKRDHAVVLCCVAKAVKGAFGAPLWVVDPREASGPRLTDEEIASLRQADDVAAETGEGAVYGQLIVLGYKEYRVEGSTWHPVGARNEKFALRRRDVANGIRRDAVYLSSAPPDKKDAHHVQVTHELENQYEHKLALEMERYDKLSEEIEAIQQRCEGLLEAQAAELTNYVRKTQTKALEYNSDIAEKQQWLKQKRLELQDTEADLYRHESAAKEGSRQLGEIQMAIHNIYLRCRVRGRQEETGEAAVLEAIKSRVTDLQAIVATLQPYLLQAQAAAAAALEASKQTALDFASRQNDGSPPGARGSVAVAAASPAAQPGTVADSLSLIHI